MMTEGKAPSRRDALFATLVIGATLIALTFKTWRKWPDLVVDFGAQLYMPWQISTGAVMYRDFHYLPGGPLSQHYHALLFKLFGVSFLTLIISNLVVLTLLLTAIYYCFYRCADQLTAITACVSVLVVFAFAHYTTLGIFNYITPYSSEVVHGLFLSVIGVALLAWWFERENPWLAAAVGFCAGLTLLTKPDMFLALTLTVDVGAALFWQVKRKGMLLCGSLGLMVAGGLIPAAGFFLWFLRIEDARTSLRSVLAAWVPLLTTSAAHGPFYRWCLGADKPWFHAREIVHWFLGLVILTLVCALVSWRKIPRRLALVPVAAAAVVIIRISSDFNWFNCGYALPTSCLVLLVLLLARAARSGWEPTVVFAVLWTLWSLAVMAKLGLFCRIWHYGFALAMPAFISSLYLLLWALPRELDRFGVRPTFLRGLLGLMVLCGLARLAVSSLNLYENKLMPVGSGGDSIIAFESHFLRGHDAAIAEALNWVEAKVPPSATLAVLPQGVLINYLSRHTNPSGYVAWSPPELAAFGQTNMNAALMAHSPDYMIELYINYSEYGETYFGEHKSLGFDAQQWIDAHYHLVHLIGHDWVKDGQFGLKILQRNPSGP